MNKFEYKNLTPFKWFVLENFPFIEADFDSLTEWQLFCKLGKEMNKIINSENTLGTQVESVTNAFIELQNYVNNYFNNLDVQEEINTKLNEMAESGQLEDIISHFLELNCIITFKNVEDMKNATNLINGSIAITLGFYEINDGGKSLYLIRNITNNDVVDNASIIALNNQNLIAELITNEVNVAQFGAKGDGITDDSDFIEKAINYANDKELNVKFMNRKEYIVSKSFYVKSGISIDGQFSTIIPKAGSYINNFIFLINTKNASTIVDNISKKQEFKNLTFNNSNRIENIKGICFSTANIIFSNLSTTFMYRISSFFIILFRPNYF